MNVEVGQAYILWCFILFFFFKNNLNCFEVSRLFFKNNLFFSKTLWTVDLIQQKVSVLSISLYKFEAVYQCEHYYISLLSCIYVWNQSSLMVIPAADKTRWFTVSHLYTHGRTWIWDVLSVIWHLVNIFMLQLTDLKVC